MRKFDAGSYRTMPWKNGGGVTTELAVHPHGAGLDDFAWRISSARVTASGPFSHFGGVDRSLAVLDGGGLCLRIDGTRAETLTAGSAPFVFRGEQRIEAELPGGPIADFNVMTRRALWTHTLEQMRLNGSAPLAQQADLLFIYCASGTRVICSSANGASVALDCGDAVLIEHADNPQLRLAAPAARLYLVHLTRQDAKNAR